MIRAHSLDVTIFGECRKKNGCDPHKRNRTTMHTEIHVQWPQNKLLGCDPHKSQCAESFLFSLSNRPSIKLLFRHLKWPICGLIIMDSAANIVGTSRRQRSNTTTTTITGTTFNSINNNTHVVLVLCS